MTERLYAADSHRTDFEARVLETRRGARGHLEARLDATCFYPTSGGQPHDTGWLADARVVDVREEGEAVWHVLEDATPGAFGEGKSVKGRIEEARRRDHREQHSGQHLLSAVLLDLARIPTAAFHLGSDVSTIDVTAERVSRDLLDRVEARCLDVIRRNVAVTARVFQGEAARAQAASLRKPPEAEALASPRGLRIVEIAGIDRDPCCGTHVGATGELGLVKVLATERGKKGETRLTFVVGGRALRATQARQNVLDELAAELTTGFAELPARLAKIQEEAKAARLEARALRTEALGHKARALAASAAGLGNGGLVLTALEGGDAGDARALASGLLEARPDLVAVVVHSGEKLTLVIGRGEKAPLLDCAATLKDVLGALGGKGGGQPSFAQGAAPDPRRAAEALALAERSIRR